MDDDKSIQIILKKMLEKHDFEVECTETGEDTLKKYQMALTSSNPFQIIILDLVIPNGMGGIQTMQELKKIDPNVRAIVTSGYLQHSNFKYCKDFGFKSILEKPFTVKELMNSIKTCLTSST